MAGFLPLPTLYTQAPENQCELTGSDTGTVPPASEVNASESTSFKAKRNAAALGTGLFEKRLTRSHLPPSFYAVHLSAA